MALCPKVIRYCLQFLKRTGRRFLNRGIARGCGRRGLGYKTKGKLTTSPQFLLTPCVSPRSITPEGKPMATDETFIELGPHDLFWIEPAWKEHDSCKEIRSAHAVIGNGDAIRNNNLSDLKLTWIPLGKHKIVIPAD